MSNDRRKIRGYLLTDFLSALAAWLVFSVFRYGLSPGDTGFSSLQTFLTAPKQLVLDFVVSAFACLVHWFLGYYSQPRLKRRSRDWFQSAVSALIVSLAIFFLAIINDYPEDYTDFYLVFIGLFVSLLFFTALPRTWITGATIARRRRKPDCSCAVPTLVAGDGQELARLRNFLRRRPEASPYFELTCCDTDSSEIDLDKTAGQIASLLESHPETECLILAFESWSPQQIQSLTNRLLRFRIDIFITVRAQEMIIGDISIDSVSGVPLRLLSPRPMPLWEAHTKRLADLLVSFIGLLLCLPLFAWLAIRIKCDSKGPVFYRQERLGKDGKPFRIIKFRSMRADAEPDGPMLSSANDPRITPVGRLLRRYRFDELPQLVNVLVGDMSLVGPRPERAFYAEQLSEKAPYYPLIWNVRPGLTSLGIVKYGYADSVDKMLRRLDYDMLYLRNQSLLMDAKVILFTIKPLALGEGV